MATGNHKEIMSLVSLNEGDLARTFGNVDLEGILGKVKEILPNQVLIKKVALLKDKNALKRLFARFSMWFDNQDYSLQSLLDEQYQSVDQLFHAATGMLDQTRSMYEYITGKRDNDSMIPLRITSKLEELRDIIFSKKSEKEQYETELSSFTFEDNPSRYTEVENEFIQAERRYNQALMNYNVLNNHVSMLIRTRDDEKQLEGTTIRSLTILGKICSYLSITRDRLDLIRSSYPILDADAKMSQEIIALSDEVIGNNNQLISSVSRDISETPSSFYLQELNTLNLGRTEPIGHPEILEIT
jgi:hypothetical protein